MTLQFLAIGDVHLGRPVARIPPWLEERGVSRLQLGPAEALKRAVERALSGSVDAVLFAGDLVDSDNAYFEGYRVLADSVKRLTDANIDVVGVAGNHDHKTLARLADEVPGFTLLGRDGTWETHEIVREEQVLGRIVGWSFPKSHVYHNPMETWVEPEGGPGWIGLLHADLTGSDQGYAPISRSDLEKTSAAAWLLGHVHIPDLRELSADRPIGYLGSLSGLSPKETGWRGAWEVEDRSGSVRLRPVDLAPLLWEKRDLSLEEMSSGESVRGKILDLLRSVREESLRRDGEVLAIGLRVRLQGRTERRAEVLELFHDMDWQGEGLPHSEPLVFLENMIDETRPCLDLNELSGGDDPVAVLAGYLNSLEAGPGSTDWEILAERGRKRFVEVSRRPTWSRLESVSLDTEFVAEVMKSGGWRLIERMLGASREDEL
ncbi:MAG: metallophosphoesterase [Planctomycetota bacterium]|jgi:DNA repair exonuclease SbcCD nuclease subunit|nr:metallophosphoesterase [Planctomycetota bacterium]